MSGRAEAQGGGASDASGKPDTRMRMCTSRPPAWRSPLRCGQGTHGGRLGALRRGQAVPSTSLTTEVRPSLAVVAAVHEGSPQACPGCSVGTRRGHNLQNPNHHPPSRHMQPQGPSLLVLVCTHSLHKKKSIDHLLCARSHTKPWVASNKKSGAQQAHGKCLLSGRVPAWRRHPGGCLLAGVPQKDRLCCPFLPGPGLQKAEGQARPALALLLRVGPSRAQPPLASQGLPPAPSASVPTGTWREPSGPVAVVPR